MQDRAKEKGSTGDSHGQSDGGDPRRAGMSGQGKVTGAGRGVSDGVLDGAMMGTKNKPRVLIMTL